MSNNLLHILVRRHLAITLAPVVSIVQSTNDSDDRADELHFSFLVPSLLFANTECFAP